MKSRNSNNNAEILIVLPTLGQRTDLLRMTLESLKAQSPVIFDLVMIFPLADKETLRLAKKYGAITVDDPGGISAAVNAGIAKAEQNHRYIGWIGDDDLLTPDSLRLAIDALNEDPGAVAAFGYCDYIDGSGKRLFTSKAGSLAPWLMTWGPNLVPCPGTVFRTDALKKVGGFDTNLKFSMDLDMFLKLRKIGRLTNVRRIQAAFRWHATSTTVDNRPRVLRETELVKRRHLPKAIRPFTPLWNYPVRLATTLAARRVNSMAKTDD